ncbi:39S ribosomal protein L16, mitochondrial [Protopterus annectens]|uniref:39S ribosomal protein L16, mitochondrial n=1 Tax=Protopterus annectens TaxID=7888 RepID=UPI001CFA9FDD|nr:39S ribosomal protein L16, mitochondrial [Protopterus annectens]
MVVLCRLISGEYYEEEIGVLFFAHQREEADRMWRFSRTLLNSTVGRATDHLVRRTAGLKTFQQPINYNDIIMPERQKLKFMDKVPNLKKPKKEPKRLSDIRGPTREASDFTLGQYGIVALGGGYLHWGHMEMMRLTINRRMDSKTTFACWRVDPPYKPLTRKGLGQRMGGGKGAIDHYVTPVKYGRLIVEVGGYCELSEVEPFLSEVAKKLPFPAKVVSRESLAQMWQEEKEKALSNQNPWTFERLVTMNMLGCRKVLSAFDLKHHGKFWGKFRLPDRV